MDIFLLILGSILIIVGLIGCVLPILPGPPISYGGIIALHVSSYGQFSSRLLVILAVVAIAVTFLDYILPVRFTKKYGGTKAGLRGSTAGLIVGLFFGPLGMILGPIIGAFIAELIHNKDSKIAVRSAMGSFMGFLLATGLKLTSSVIMAYYFIKEVF